MCKITATEKQQRENGQRNIGLRENSATKTEKKGQHKIIVWNNENGNKATEKTATGKRATEPLPFLTFTAAAVTSVVVQQWRNRVFTNYYQLSTLYQQNVWHAFFLLLSACARQVHLHILLFCLWKSNYGSHPVVLSFYSVPVRNS